MIGLDASMVLLQWATGALLFLWVTTRRRLVGLGYGWLMRSIFGLMAVGAIAAGRFSPLSMVRDVGAGLCALAALVALVVSVVRRKAGVSGQDALAEARSARVAAMTGIDRRAEEKDTSVAEFPPVLDLVAPVMGAVGLVGAALAAGGPAWLSIARTMVGAAFLGAVTDAMSLGHWYLVQPGLPRRPILELNRWLMILWPVEVALLLVPTGMFSVLNGTIKDGYGGMLGWFWVACVFTTIGLAIATQAALKERFYSAVMAATGLLYLAILTAFGTDLVARLLLRP